MDVNFGDTKLTGRPNLAAIAVMKALRDACKDAPADDKGWVSPATDGAWYAKAVDNGVSESKSTDNIRQTFIRTVKLLTKSGYIERNILTGLCRPMAEDDATKLPDEDKEADRPEAPKQTNGGDDPSGANARQAWHAAHDKT
jgi:hypothetical protein